MASQEFPVPQILCIGQSDSSAGTGLQADIKTAQAFGVYAACAVTAVAAQDTSKIHELHVLPAAAVRSQIEAVLGDIPPQVIKTGMMGATEVIAAVGEIFDAMGHAGPMVVVDPVMTSRAGHVLLDKQGRDILKRSFLVYADILTPNIREASEFTGMEIRTVDDMCRAAEMLRTLGPGAVILKGGALPTADGMIYDVIADDEGTKIFTSRRRDTTATHGAGSTLAAGVACCLAHGMSPRKAYAVVRTYLDEAIATAPAIGHGHGPLNHAVSGLPGIAAAPGQRRAGQV